MLGQDVVVVVVGVVVVIDDVGEAPTGAGEDYVSSGRRRGRWDPGVWDGKVCLDFLALEH